MVDIESRAAICAAILLKPTNQAKSRLTRLDEYSRRNLALAMAEDVVASACRSGAFGIVWVVGSDPAHREIALRHGATFLWEGVARGLNGAAAFAIQTAAQSGYRWCTLLPGDIPLADARTIRRATHALLAAMWLDGERVGVVPCRHGRGTNLMVCNTVRTPALFYGADSFQKHLTASPGAKILRSRRLGLDIDEACDLAALSTALAATRSHDSRTAAFLQHHPDQGSDHDV